MGQAGMANMANMANICWQSKDEASLWIAHRKGDRR